MVTDDLLFNLVCTFSPLLYGPKSTRLNKIYISTRKSSLSEVNFSPIWINTIVHILMYTMDDYPVWFTMLTNIIYYNPIPYMGVPFFFFPYIENKNVKRGRGKGDRKQLRNSNHKVKHIIGFYPKYLLIFTAYQLQGWWTIIISPVKYQPGCSNVWENLPKIS